MSISLYFIYFIVFSICGWLYECMYCTIRDGHWNNRGFLFGPVCPIYGIGVVTAMLIFHDMPSFSSHTAAVWEIFFICAVGSAVLEYATSWALEHFFHAIWWDYSKVPFNIQGRVCLPATFGFGAAGVLVVRFVLPWIYRLPRGYEHHPQLIEATALLLMFLLGIDLALTVASLTQLIARMEEIQAKFDEKVEDVMLTGMQKRHLYSIRTFRNECYAGMAAKLQSVLEDIWKYGKKQNEEFSGKEKLDDRS